MSPSNTQESKYKSYELDEATNTIKVNTELNFLYDPNKHPPLSTTEIVTSLFNTTTLVLFVGFLATYFLIYFLVSKFHGSFTSLNIIKGQAINYTCLVLLIAGGLYFYYSLPKSNQENIVRYTMLLFQDEMNDPNTIFIMVEFLVVFYAIVYLMGLPMGRSEKPFSLHIIELKSWLYIAMLVLILFFIYVLNIEIVDLVYFEFYRMLDFAEKTTQYGGEFIKPSHAPSPAPSHATAATPSTIQVSTEETTKKQEVFNVSNNLYTYDDAQAICKAYGARLATYDDMEQAYEAGAEWCNYGWSDGQMAYFPTQKSTWEKLQKDPATKHNCGRPGINGGYIANPNIKFGVNCYGVKPPPNQFEQDMLKSAKTTASCPAAGAASVVDPNVEKWKQKLDSMRLNSHNNDEWSQFD